MKESISEHSAVYKRSCRALVVESGHKEVRPSGQDRGFITGENLLVMLISTYKPFITADEQLIRLPEENEPWSAALARAVLMHSECLSITR